MQTASVSVVRETTPGGMITAGGCEARSLRAMQAQNGTSLEIAATERTRDSSGGQTTVVNTSV